MTYAELTAKKSSRIEKIALAAMFMALNIILTRFGSFMVGGMFRVGFGLVPLHVAGYILGPLWGLAVGVMSDVLGVFITTYGEAPHLGFTLTTGLHGFIPGAVIWLWNRGVRLRRGDFVVMPRWPMMGLVLMSQITCFLGLSVGLQTLWVAQLRGNTYWVTLASRFVPTLLQNIVLLFVELGIFSTTVMRKMVLRVQKG